MFELKINGIHEAGILKVREEWPTKIVSLVDPATERDWLVPSENHHIEKFDDIAVVMRADHNYILPSREAIARVLEFTKTLVKEDKLLVHCHAGISRSTAMAIGILVQHGVDPERAIKYVEEVRPPLFPNSLVIQHIDDELGLNGELVEALRKWVQSVQGHFYMPPEVTQEHVDEMKKIQDLLKGLE